MLPESLGEVFTTAEQSLQMYVDYCKCKATSHALLQDHAGFFEVSVLFHFHFKNVFCVFVFKCIIIMIVVLYMGITETSFTFDILIIHVHVSWVQVPPEEANFF